MRLIRFSILVLLLVAGALIAFGSPGSAERDQASEAAEQAAAGSPQAEEAEEGGGPPLETFIPSERLPADSAISFPVDI
jgi:hypothetical protein